jgi:vacuolar-type H+-ATPase subunit C/Vma6
MLLQVLLACGDASALVAIFRGKGAGSPPEDILPAVLPTGALDRARLVALVDLPGIPECLAKLARWRLPLASSLVGLDSHGWERDRSVQPLEMALWRGLITWSRAQLRGRDPNTTLVREALALSIDVFNVGSAVRVLHRGAGPPARNAEDMFVAGGNVPLDRLAAAIGCTTVEEGLEQLGSTPLTRAILARPTTTTGDLSSDAELAMEGYFARWAQRQIFRDPLGIGVALAYHAAKVQEVRRLRLIARALHAEWPRYRVRELLEVPSLATTANRL